MAHIYNNDVADALIKSARIAVATDKVPDELAEKVVPILDVTPRVHRIITISRGVNSTSTGNATIYSPSSTRDFYITNASLAYVADATADNTSIVISASIGGVYQNLIRLPKFTTTATSGSMAVNFPFPIKIDRTLAVVMNTAFTVGACSFSATIQGYEVDA